MLYAKVALFPYEQTAYYLYADKESLHPELWQFNQAALQEYILCCCQCARGGLIDKPGKTKDFYHTCYCLSGLSVSQHCFGNKETVNITDDSDAILVLLI